MTVTLSARRPRHCRNPITVISCLLVALLGSILFSLLFGSLGPIGPGKPVAIHLDDLLSVIAGSQNQYSAIVWSLRLPRAILASLVGAALSLSGTGIQGLLRNPVAEPYSLGISSGAALGGSLWLLYGSSAFSLGLPASAFCSALATVGAVYTLGRVNGILRTDTILLAGISVGSFLAALTFFVMYSSSESLNRIIFWLLGGFNLSSQPWQDIEILSSIIAIGTIVLVLLRRELNALVFGEETAHTLGVSPEATKRIVLLVTTLLTASAVAISGIIGFVGLVIPHMMRLLIGADHARLIPASAVAGGIFLVWSDAIARTILAPEEIPVGVITAFFGTPFFIFLLRARKRSSYAP